MGWFDEFLREQVVGTAARGAGAAAEGIEEIKKRLRASSDAGFGMRERGNPGIGISNPFAGLNPGGSPQSGGFGGSGSSGSFGASQTPTNPNWKPTEFKTQNAPRFDGGGRRSFDAPTELSGRRESNPLDDIFARLGENFDFDGVRGAVDTSAFDDALAQRMALIDQAKGNANSNFSQSDANIKAMHDAFVNDTRAQSTAISDQYVKSGNDLKAIFGDTIQDNNAAAAESKRTQEEMLSRLGIAPAANQPDLVGEQYAKANTAAQQSQDARLTQNAEMGMIAQDRNENFAKAIGSEGLGRRTQLNQQLQDILGTLDMRGADYQDEAMSRKMDYQDNRTNQSYERFLQDRNFDFNQLQEQNSYNIGMESARGESEAKMAEAAAKGQEDNSVQGFDGLWGQTPDPVKKAILNVSQKVNIDQDPQKALKEIKRMSEKDPSINYDEVYRYMQKRATLGTTNKFAPQ